MYADAEQSATYPAYNSRDHEKYRAKRRKYQGLPDPTRPEPTACECCGKSRGKKAMHLDHCHVSGFFRGWLCGECNTGLGKFGDSIEGLMNAVRYLQRAIRH